MKLCFTILLVFFSVYGSCQESNNPPKNVIFGSLQINKTTPAVSISYERVLYRKEQIDFGLFILINATNYKEYHRSDFIQPYFSLGMIVSVIPSKKNRLEAMAGVDFHPYRPQAVYFHGKLAYVYHIPKINLGLRGFLIGNLDTNYKVYLENPSLTLRQQVVQTLFYWSIGVAVGKYF